MKSGEFDAEQIRILECVAAGEPLSKTLQRIVQLIEASMDGVCSILLVDLEHGTIHHGAAPHLPHEFIHAIDGAKFSATAGSCGAAAALGHRIVVSDIEHDPLWKDYRRLALPFGLKACWSSPIFSPAHKVLGTFAVYYKTVREPTEFEIGRVDAATHLTAVAILREQGEIALRRSEARSRQISEMTSEGLFSLNLDERLVWTNARTAKMLGYKQEALLHTQFFDLLPASEHSKIKLMLSRRRRGLNDHMEIRIKNREGQLLWAILTLAPISDEAGNISGTLGILTDITERKQAEAALTRSEAELRSMFESAVVGMALIDAVTRPVTSNPALTRLLGYTEKELTRTTLLELTHPSDLEMVLQKRRLLDSVTEEGVKIECRYRQKGGRYVWTRVTFSPIRPSEETVPYALAMIEDISESKDLEEEVAAAAKLRSLIFDTINDSLFYIEIHPDGRLCFLSVNHAFLEITGLKRDQVIGKFVDEVFPRSPLAQVVGKYEKAIKERRRQTWEEILSNPTGTKYGEVTVTPHFDQNERCAGLVGIVHDITERKKAEEKIAAQAALLDQAHDAILLRKFNGTILYWNQGAAALYGWSSAEAVGRSVLDLNYRKSEAFKKAQDQLLANGLWKGEMLQCTKDGKEIVVDVSWTLMRDAKDAPQAVLSINTDITEKKKLQRQISLAQRMDSLGTLAGGIAHDFNNILTALLGNISLAQNCIPNDSRAQKYLAIAVSACSRAENLISKILTFSRDQTQGRDAIALQPVLMEALELLRSTLPAMMDLECDWAPDVPMICADSSQIHQIIMNLGTNAAHAMGDHGTLSVRLEPVLLDRPLAGVNSELSPGLYARLTVEDTGCGMDEETLSRAFEPFFTTRLLNQGTGLGLSVVHRIVHDHGGAIVVKSQPGEGTRFQIYFPAAERVLTEESAVKITDPLLGQGERILYIDDEVSILTLSTQILEGFGYQVSGFSDPCDALKAFSSTPHEFDAVLTDYAMPRLSGVQVAREILTIRPDIPVLLTSGHLRPRDEQIARKLGIREILKKPGSVSSIVYALGRQLHTEA